MNRESLVGRRRRRSVALLPWAMALFALLASAALAAAAAAAAAAPDSPPPPPKSTERSLANSADLLPPFAQTLINDLSSPARFWDKAGGDARVPPALAPFGPPPRPRRNTSSALPRPKVAGPSSNGGSVIDVSVVGASSNLDAFVASYLSWIRDVTPPFAPLPSKAGKLPPLPDAFRAEVDYVRSMRRGAYPSLVKGRPELLTVQATDPLQNGEIDSLPPGAGWVGQLVRPQAALEAVAVAADKGEEEATAASAEKKG